MRAAFGFGCLLALVLAGCGKSKNPASVDAAPPAASASAANDEEVRPVYPTDGVTPHPLAVRLCDALHDLPEKRRAACCSQSTRTVPTSECVRMASAALNDKAISIASEAIDACRTAMEKVHTGCDWVGPFPPPVPAACLGIMKGTLPDKARCRSTLECSGELRCHGVGPTSAGRCGPPKPDGAACFGTADALAAVTRQDDVDATHRECSGFCDRIKCAPVVPDGGACEATRQCGAGHVCSKGKCIARALAKLGEPCTTGDACERGLRCVDGKCSERKAAGAACERDFDCLGGCVKKDGGAKGVCGQKCDVR